jgi:hypothetical protein
MSSNNSFSSRTYLALFHFLFNDVPVSEYARIDTSERDSINSIPIYSVLNTSGNIKV